jgi:hypothetical protein
VDEDIQYGAGIKHSDLIEAIKKSGYPLQTVVARQFQQRAFDVQEEWAFLDSLLISGVPLMCAPIVASGPSWRMARSSRMFDQI